MTLNAALVQTLLPFGLPIRTDFYEGAAEEYFTFNYADDRGADFGDDKPGEVIAAIQLHYFLPMEKDYLEMKKGIRKAIHKAGFTYPSVEILTEPKNHIRHIIFEFEAENDGELDNL